MNSRNATREDFDKVMAAMKNEQIDPAKYITHRVLFEKVKSEFG